MNETKNMRSIARQFNRKWVGQLLAAFLFLDILIFAFVFSGWCYFQETENGQDFSYKTHRAFKQIGSDEKVPGHQAFLEKENYTLGTANFEEKVKNTKYVFGGKEVYAGKFLVFLHNAVVFMLFVQLLILLSQILTGAKRARGYLAPLDEMSKKAAALANAASRDASKFQDLETAISNFSPVSEDAYLVTGDSELQSLEHTINNMIDKMRQAYQQQARFVSDASHELRTPISVIQGYANMLDRWGKEDERILEESIGAIKSESDHMKRLVEQLLFLARGDSGRTKLAIEEFSLTEVTKEVYNESVMIDRDHRYRMKHSEEMKISGDPSMIKQAIRILVDNAAKYTPKGAEILLWAEKNHKGEACFVVQDEGIGMDEGDVPHIFERFFRSDPARSRDSGGTGLGLSIAKWIVDKHDGYFQVLSREEIGTRIRICLPVSQKQLTPD